MQLRYTDVLSYSRESAQLVSNLQDDKHNGVDGGINMKAEGLKVDLFEQSVWMR